MLGDSLSKLHQSECIDFDSSASALKSEVANLLVELEELSLAYDPGASTSSLDTTPESASSVTHLTPGTTSAIAGLGDLLSAVRKERLKGVSFEAIYTSEIMSNVKGGMRQGANTLDNFDLTVSVDADELVGWKGASLFLYGLGNHGGSPSDFADDLQTVSNIDAPNAWKLYEAWIEQCWFGEKLSLRAGLYDVNSEFDALEAAGLFLNSSHGIGPEISQTGRNGPSIFPTTSIGVRAKTQVAGACYAQMVALDGVPGDPNNPRGTHILLSESDGALIVSELGVELGNELHGGKYALGIFAYTASMDDILNQDAAGNPMRRRSRPGFYLLAEQSVLRESDSNQGLALFGRAGIADERVNQLGAYTGAGLMYTGLFPGRKNDQAGVALAVAHNGGPFKQSQRAAGHASTDAEVALEFTYRCAIAPWLVVQPDVQYVVNPGVNAAISNAFLLGTRVEVSF